MQNKHDTKKSNKKKAKQRRKRNKKISIFKTVLLSPHIKIIFLIVILLSPKIYDRIKFEATTFLGEFYPPFGYSDNFNSSSNHNNYLYPKSFKGFTRVKIESRKVKPETMRIKTASRSSYRKYGSKKVSSTYLLVSLINEDGYQSYYSAYDYQLEKFGKHIYAFDTFAYDTEETMIDVYYIVCDDSVEIGYALDKISAANIKMEIAEIIESFVN